MALAEAVFLCAAVAFVARRDQAPPFFDPAPHFDPTLHVPRATELFAKMGLAEASRIEGFPFQLTLRAHTSCPSPRDFYHAQRIDGVRFALEGWSDSKVPWDATATRIESKTHEGDGLIDVRMTTTRPFGMLGGRTGNRSPVPEKSFHFLIESFWLPPDRPVYLRIRFKDATELFALAIDRGGRLKVVPVQCRYGRVYGSWQDLEDGGWRRRRPIEFTKLECADGKTTLQCTPVALAAHRDGGLIWSHPIWLHGQPKIMHVVDNTIFVATTGGHSFYARKTSGEMLYYCDHVLPGKDPVAEIIDLGRKAIQSTPVERRNLPAYISALVELGDRRAIPFLIDTIGRGSMWPEVGMSIAALEYFNGHPEKWQMYGRELAPHAHGLRFNVVHDYQTERDRWRQIFNLGKEKQ